MDFRTQRRLSLGGASLTVLALLLAGCQAPSLPPVKEAPVQTPVEQLRLVELKTRLPEPEASERVELYDRDRGRLFSFVGYIPPGPAAEDRPPGPHPRPRTGRFPGTVWSAALGAMGLYDLREETALPSALVGRFGAYWGRAALPAGGRWLYLTGTFDTQATLVAPLDRRGIVGAWRATTPLPPSPVGRRSLHRVFVTGPTKRVPFGQLYLLGGWHTDGQPGLTTVHRAPVRQRGDLGAFTAQNVRLPAGATVGFSLARRGERLYLAHGSAIWSAPLNAGGLSTFQRVFQDNRLDHNNYGGSGLACGDGLLLLVDVAKSHLFTLTSDGTPRHLRTLEHPAPFGQRTVFYHRGKFHITTNHGGRIYRLE